MTTDGARNVATPPAASLEVRYAPCKGTSESGCQIEHGNLHVTEIIVEVAAHSPDTKPAAVINAQAWYDVSWQCEKAAEVRPHLVGYYGTYRLITRCTTPPWSHIDVIRRQPCPSLTIRSVFSPPMKTRVSALGPKSGLISSGSKESGPSTASSTQFFDVPSYIHVPSAQRSLARNDPT
eukprot:scaffold1890_cov380-Prasinococcus_capsulatus_cf.AAC.10